LSYDFIVFHAKIEPLTSTLNIPEGLQLACKPVKSELIQPAIGMIMFRKFIRSFLGSILALFALFTTLAQGQELDTTSGIKSMIENLALGVLGPVGDAVSVLQNSPDIVRTGLLVWLKPKISDAILSGDDNALEKYSSFYLCIANNECEGVRKFQSAAQPQGKQGKRAGGAKGEDQATFKIYEAFVPSVILSGGRKGALTVYWGGAARFPVTMIYRPTASGCAKDINCTSPEMTFSSETDPLIFRDAVWCTGVQRSVYFGYEVVLRDAAGKETAPAPAAFRCQATRN